MITLDLAEVLTAYFACLLAVIFGVWVYYGFRRRAWLSAPVKKVIYRCGRCQHFYVEAGGRQPCPQCTHQNEPLQF